MIKVTSITKTCEGCPAQWDGITDDNRKAYFRYRWGRLTVELGKKDDMEEFAAVFGELVFEQFSGDDLDGVMDYKTLKELTKGVLELPDIELRDDETTIHIVPMS